ncbi:MAG TPA: thioredoxin domain-containing protein [Enteractinococcus helveticum]|uniref:Thioredoxin domain-containing protein n=1 Tax=Enteractinococcus helveticum TaxID=1837282 RepID=A0A921K7X4_9MICC|nr:thioredoxin domain-containing protein [Enteractinococcus helveticum]HJF15157.1 thioredoxin domain-containing protein [Enteractinococcus helveticum]
MPQQTTSSKPPWLLPVIVGVIALAVIVLAYFIFASSDRAEPSAATEQSDDRGVVDVAPQSETDQVDLSFVERRDDTDPLSIGTVDAPVTMVVFSDYQCPFCASWNQDTLPIMMDYVESDQLRIEWRDLNVFGPESEQASKAAYAAALQDAFWEYHDELFADGDIRDPAELSEEALVELAAELGLDTEQFTTDMQSDQVAEQVLINQQLGTDLGAYSTPSFIVDGQPMVGAQPTDVFVNAVDEALAQPAR